MICKVTIQENLQAQTKQSLLTNLVLYQDEIYTFGFSITGKSIAE